MFLHLLIYHCAWSSLSLMITRSLGIQAFHCMLIPGGIDLRAFNKASEVEDIYHFGGLHGKKSRLAVAAGSWASSVSSRSFHWDDNHTEDSDRNWSWRLSFKISYAEQVVLVLDWLQPRRKGKVTTDLSRTCLQWHGLQWSKTIDCSKASETDGNVMNQNLMPCA